MGFLIVGEPPRLALGSRMETGLGIGVALRQGITADALELLMS
jgi:hypothetical protein